MKKLNLFAGIAVALSGLFAGQTFAASGCITSACDPAAAAAACDPAAAAPAAPTPADCNSGCLSATCASSPTCDPAAAAACNTACNTGCNATCTPGCTPGCAAGCNSGCKSGCLSLGCGGACSACGNFGCDGFCQRHGCADVPLGKLKKSIYEGTCWSGYMNAGYFSNFKGDHSNGYTDCWSETSPAFNALYVAATKKAYTGGCGYDIGFGVDFMFGEDSRLFRSARGLDQNWYTGHMSDGRASYGFAMPQLYTELAFNNWSVKAGHFYGLLGYEGATANSRFFYTKGLLCSISPVSQTGVLASYNGFQNVDMTLGWVNGWNNGFDNSEYGEGMVTGAFTYHMNENASIKYAFLAGTSDIAAPLGALGPLTPATAKGDASVHNVVLDLQVTGRLEEVYLFNYGDFDGNTVIMLGEHFYYDLNCCTKLGFRAEWMKATIDGQASEMTSFSLGFNYHPNGNKNLFIRPELRYDKVVGENATQLLNGRVDQMTMGFDVMLTF